MAAGVLAGAAGGIISTMSTGALLEGAAPAVAISYLWYFDFGWPVISLVVLIFVAARILARRAAHTAAWAEVASLKAQASKAAAAAAVAAASESNPGRCRQGIPKQTPYQRNLNKAAVEEDIDPALLQCGECEEDDEEFPAAKCGHWGCRDPAKCFAFQPQARGQADAGGQ